MKFQILISEKNKQKCQILCWICLQSVKDQAVPDLKKTLIYRAF